MNKQTTYLVLTAVVSLLVGGVLMYAWGVRSNIQNTKVVYQNSPAALVPTNESKRVAIPADATVKQTVLNPWTNAVAFLVSEDVGLSKNANDVLSRYSVYVMQASTGEMHKLYELPVSDLEKIHSALVSLEWKDKNHVVFDMTDYITGGEKLELEVK